jgi:hypothetical protein
MLTEQERFDQKCAPNPETGCVEWTAYCNPHGYGSFFRHKSHQFVFAHRWAYERAHGPIPEGLCVLHHCDNPRCVNVDHLWLGTKLDNARDRDAKKRRIALRGEQHGRAKLQPNQIHEIRILAANGHSPYGIAKNYGINSKTARDIIERKLWRHITGEMTHG